MAKSRSTNSFKDARVSLVIFSRVWLLRRGLIALASPGGKTSSPAFGPMQGCWCGIASVLLELRVVVGGCCLGAWDADDGMLCCVGLPTIGMLCNAEIYQANIKLLTIRGPHFFYGSGVTWGGGESERRINGRSINSSSLNPYITVARSILNQHTHDKSLRRRGPCVTKLRKSLHPRSSCIGPIVHGHSACPDWCGQYYCSDLSLDPTFD